MLLNLFSALYSVIGTSPSPDEYDAIYPFLTFLTIFISAATSAIFYLVINNWKMGFHRLSHWFITLSINSSICWTLGFLQGVSALGGSDPFNIILGSYIAVIASLFFFLFSVLFKRFSKLAYTVPF